MQQLIKEFNRENLKPIVFITIALVLLAVTAYPQRRFGGRVIEIVDGKTAVIQVPTGGKTTIVLQFIEIPEAEQPLHQTVKQHLEKLILDKTVEFVPRRILQKGSVGQVFLGGVDISQQMLRDGAAWYALPEKSAQDAQESAIYQTTESQAKTEKRGVWSIENIKPAWEFRAEKEEQKREAEKAKLEAQIPSQIVAETKPKPVKPKLKLDLDVDMWSNVANNSSNIQPANAGTGLIMGNVAAAGAGYVSTSGDYLNLSNGGSQPKIESRAIYGYAQENSKLRNNGYVIGFLSDADQYIFADSNNLTITADKQNFALGKPYRLFRQTPSTYQEFLVYEISAAALSKISRAKNVEIKIGKYSGKISDNYKLRIKNLLTVTE